MLAHHPFGLSFRHVSWLGLDAHIATTIQGTRLNELVQIMHENAISTHKLLSGVVTNHNLTTTQIDELFETMCIIRHSYNAIPIPSGFFENVRSNKLSNILQKRWFCGNTITLLDVCSAELIAHRNLSRGHIETLIDAGPGHFSSAYYGEIQNTIALNPSVTREDMHRFFDVHSHKLNGWVDNSIFSMSDLMTGEDSRVSILNTLFLYFIGASQKMVDSWYAEIDTNQLEVLLTLASIISTGKTSAVSIELYANLIESLEKLSAESYNIPRFGKHMYLQLLRQPHAANVSTDRIRATMYDLTQDLEFLSEDAGNLFAF